MTAIDSPSPERRLSRPLLFLGLPLLAIALTLFFAVARFPYDRLREPIARELEASAGVTVTIGSLGPFASVFGAGLVFRDTLVEWGDGQLVRVDQLAVRPAWSMSWLRLNPALKVRLRAPVGNANGVAVLSGAPGWEGSVEAFDLELLPIDSLMSGLGIEGSMNAEIDLHTSGEEESSRLDGDVTFAIGNGSLTLPNLPVTLPFESMTGSIAFGGEHTAVIESLDLQGPILIASVAGTIGLSERPGQEPLDLAVAVEVKDPSVKTLLRRSGVRLEKDGQTSIKLTGTLSRPVAQ